MEAGGRRAGETDDCLRGMAYSSAAATPRAPLSSTRCLVKLGLLLLLLLVRELSICPAELNMCMNAKLNVISKNNRKGLVDVQYIYIFFKCKHLLGTRVYTQLSEYLCRRTLFINTS